MNVYVYTHTLLFIEFCSLALFFYLYYELSVITKYSLEILNSALGTWQDAPHVTVVLQGHCCTRGRGEGPCENMNGRGCEERFQGSCFEDPLGTGAGEIQRISFQQGC